MVEKDQALNAAARKAADNPLDIVTMLEVLKSVHWRRLAYPGQCPLCR